MSQLWINDIVKVFYPILQKSGIFEQIKKKSTDLFFILYLVLDKYTLLYISWHGVFKNSPDSPKRPLPLSAFQLAQL